MSFIPSLDFANVKRPPVTLALEGVKPVLEAQFAAGAATQEVKLPAPATGRYFCLEALNAQDGKQFAAIAEIDLLDKDGKPISHQGWSIAYVDSKEHAREDGSAENAINGQNASFWHTQWGDAHPDFPHRFIPRSGPVPDHLRLPLRAPAGCRGRGRPDQGLPHLRRRWPGEEVNASRSRR